MYSAFPVFMLMIFRSNFWFSGHSLVFFALSVSMIGSDGDLFGHFCDAGFLVVAAGSLVHSSSDSHSPHPIRLGLHSLHGGFILIEATGESILSDSDCGDLPDVWNLCSCACFA